MLSHDVIGPDDVIIGPDDVIRPETMQYKVNRYITMSAPWAQVLSSCPTTVFGANRLCGLLALGLIPSIPCQAVQMQSSSHASTKLPRATALAAAAVSDRCQRVRSAPAAQQRLLSMATTRRGGDRLPPAGHPRVPSVTQATGVARVDCYHDVQYEADAAGP